MRRDLAVWVSGRVRGVWIAPDPGEIDWSETGLVSIFIRDRIGDQASLAGGTVRSTVHVAEGLDGVRKRLREQIRRNERRGWSIEATLGPDASPAAQAAFERAYGETMARTGAAERYLFESSYFERLLAAKRSWLVLASREGAASPGRSRSPATATSTTTWGARRTRHSPTRR